MPCRLRLLLWPVCAHGNACGNTPSIDVVINDPSARKGAWFFEKDHFWDGLFIWYMGYLRNPKDKTVLNIDLEYFNSQTSSRLMSLLKMTRFLEKKGAGRSVKYRLSYKGVLFKPIILEDYLEIDPDIDLEKKDLILIYLIIFQKVLFGYYRMGF
jgi:hypothetical protein